MLIRKIDQGYEVSGGISWIPLLPGKIKTKKELNQYYQERANQLTYATDDFKKARLYEVTWWKNNYTEKFHPRILIDEDKSLIMEKAFASEQEITEFLKARAKGEGMEAVIRFVEARPEPTEENNE